MKTFLKWTGLVALCVLLPWYALAAFSIRNLDDGGWQLFDNIAGVPVLTLRNIGGQQQVQILRSDGQVVNRLDRWCGVTHMSDVTTVTTAMVASPVTGYLDFVETVLHATIQGSNAVLTVRVDGTSVGTITVTAAGSRWGDINNLTGGFSTHTVSRGSYITIASDGGPANETIPLDATVCVRTG